MKYVVDTSFLLSSLDPDDAFYTIAASDLTHVDYGDEIIIPLISVSEFLIGQKNIEKGISYCKSFCENFEMITESDLEFFENLDINQRKSLKSNDCLILAICKRKKAKLLTFDARLEKAYKKL